MLLGYKLQILFFAGPNIIFYYLPTFTIQSLNEIRIPKTQKCQAIYDYHCNKLIIHQLHTSNSTQLFKTLTNAINNLHSL